MMTRAINWHRHRSRPERKSPNSTEHQMFTNGIPIRIRCYMNNWNYFSNVFVGQQPMYHISFPSSSCSVQHLIWIFSNRIFSLGSSFPQTSLLRLCYFSTRCFRCFFLLLLIMMTMISSTFSHLQRVRVSVLMCVCALNEDTKIHIRMILDRS